MRKFIFVWGCLFLASSSIWAQKPVAAKAIQLFQGKKPATFALFNPATEAKDEVKPYLGKAHSMTIRPEVLLELRNADLGLIRLQLPTPLNIKLDLYRADVFSDEAMIKTSDGRSFTPNPEYQFFRGIISGNPNSIAIVSVFAERIQIAFSDQTGNKRIQRSADGKYLLYADEDILTPKNLECFTDESKGIHPAKDTSGATERVLTGNCVEVYVECEFKCYQDNGNSVPNTEEWVAELWNEVITLYENEDIPVAVSDILVYTSAADDPFDQLNSTSAVLNAFVAHIDTFTYIGRLAHLLTTRTLGGGIAYLDVLCSNSYQCAFSANLVTNIIPVPTYSWSVEVVTHEMGHNMGSPHTHACAWNGNNTQIDDCGNQYAANNGGTPEGAACYNSNSPILPTGTGGTIMSYCHLIGNVGINFNNGFGTQPGNLIRDRYNNASCNTGTCSPPLCTTLTTPAAGATNVDINQDLFWASAPGASGYKLTIGTSPTNGSILNNVDVGLVTTYNPANPLPFGTTIYVKIVPYNSLGDAVGCTNQSFTTEGNVAPQCTQITAPANGAVEVPIDVIIYWAHSAGNQTGYKISIGTTLNGTNIANLVDVGNVNFYNHPSSFPYGATLYVKITPYWSGGDITGCASQSFTTYTPIAGDFCTNAINLPCGGSISGNTELALSDPELPFCAVDIEAPGLWYTFVGDGTNAVIATCSQYGYDTQLNAYQGTCANLVCVTGIDDFCYTGSLISFPTVSGTTYYILVQGWGGEQGTFTLTRTCYTGPFYCTASGRDAFTEWVGNVTFAGISTTSGSSSYSDYMATPITVSRGATYSISITPTFLQGTRSEYFKVWIDYNHDGDFTDGGEQVFSAGPSTTTVSGNITIPVTATRATTRMRVAMRYNATPSSSCGTYENGEVEDYTLNIRCNLVTSTADDTGNGTLRNVSTCADDSENILFSAALNNQIINITNGPIVVDGIWKWMATAGTNIQIKAGTITRLLTVPLGKSMEIQNLKLYGGTTATGSTIDNAGTLLLRDTNVYPAAGSSSIPVRNNGTANIFGLCNIRL
jgi:hypothetical protein